MQTTREPVVTMAAEEMARLRGITAVTPTLLALMGLPLPDGLADPPLPEVLQSAAVRPIERGLVIAADAIGLAQRTAHPAVLAPLAACAPQVVTLRAMYPSSTPVCYASMFSGVTPEVHGIRSYTKPVLTVPTLFDFLPAAGKRVAIVATAGCSIDRIFRERPVAYFSEADDAQVVRRATQLLADDQYDVLVAYLCAYDEALHRSTPWTEEAIGALQQVVADCLRLSTAMHAGPWRGHARAILIAPDHGAHTNADGYGVHGSDLPDDMVVLHNWGVFAPSAE